MRLLAVVLAVLMGCGACGGESRGRPTTAYAVSGVVIGSDGCVDVQSAGCSGEPVPNAKIELLFFDRVMGVVTADGQGRWRFARVQAGEFALRVLGPGYITSGSLPAVRVRDRDVQVRLVGNRRVHGTGGT